MKVSKPLARKVAPIAAVAKKEGPRSTSVEMTLAKVCGKVVHFKSAALMDKLKAENEMADNIYVSKDFFSGIDWKGQDELVQKNGHGSLTITVTITTD